MMDNQIAFALSGCIASSSGCLKVLCAIAPLRSWPHFNLAISTTLPYDAYGQYHDATLDMRDQTEP